MYLRHFEHLGAEQRRALFEIAPAPMSSENLTGVLGFGLGATLSLPLGRPHLAHEIVRLTALGVQSVVLEPEGADGADAAVRRLAWSAALAETLATLAALPGRRPLLIAGVPVSYTHLTLPTILRV